MRGLIPFALLLALAFVLAGCLGAEGDLDDDDPSDRDENPGEEATDDETRAPDQLAFEYGPSLGCAGAGPDGLTCVSAQLGPDQPAVDGYWQELDESYWRLEFTVTNGLDAYPDTDCTAFDENQEPIDADLNNAEGPCGGSLPQGTKWLFLYSWIAPSPSMELEFTV